MCTQRVQVILQNEGGTSKPTEGKRLTILGVLDNVNGRGLWSDFAVMLSQSDSKPPPHPLNVPSGYVMGVSAEGIGRSSG